MWLVLREKTSFPPPEIKACGQRLSFALGPPPHRREKAKFYSTRLAVYSNDDVVSGVSEEDGPPQVMDNAFDENDMDRRDEASEGMNLYIMTTVSKTALKMKGRSE